MLHYIDREYSPDWYNTIDRRRQRLPDPAVVKTPRTPLLMQMFGKVNLWEMTHLFRKQQEQDDECSPVDPVLWNGLGVHKLANGSWVITVDSTIATNLEIMWKELGVIEDWLRGQINHWSSHSTSIAWEASPQGS